jgi:large subunit ribosomal protein L9
LSVNGFRGWALRRPAIEASAIAPPESFIDFSTSAQYAFSFPIERVSGMKVILQENVEGVGHLGDVLDVKDGFARNYLLPRRKALQASPRNVKAFEHTKRVMGERAKKEKLEIEGLAKKLSAVSLTITAQVGKDDKLFGSVTVKDIAEGLAAQGFEVDRRKIQLGQPIKELGTFTVPVKLHRDVTASVTVLVGKKQEADPPPEAT